MLLKNKIILFSIIIGLITFIAIRRTENVVLPKKIKSTSSHKAAVESKKGRQEYFFNMLRDPATNRIPRNIRSRELNFAKSLPSVGLRFNKSGASMSHEWSEVGPNDVGGRTRALAVDLTNSNVLLAGGISGGIWKTTDGGASWSLKNMSTQNLSVTSIAQDPTSTNIWYYSTGEFNGNSAADRSQGAIFTGDGFYKSLNNGETWAAVPGNIDDPTVWDDLFDYVSRVVVSPTTGTVFIASHRFGIFRSLNGGDTFSNSFGVLDDHTYLDVAITSDGKIVVVASSGFNNPPTDSAGVYLSVDDGANWSDVTPAGYPADAARGVVAVTPASPDSAWVLTFTGFWDVNGREDVRLYGFDFKNGVTKDLTPSLPNFDDLNGSINSQGSYNLVLAIKPDDKNSIYVGGTSLFRSSNGFTNSSADTFQTWIGGYFPDGTFNQYPTHHPDQHVIAFSPTDPNTMWIGNDGGIKKVTDVSVATTVSSLMPWIDMNNGYNVTQFYDVSISKIAGDDRIMGGTQDNGTPYFRWNGTTSTASEDISFGDGAYSYFGNVFAYVSTQFGAILRINYDGLGNPNNSFNSDPGTTWSIITPDLASGQLFINPFEVDPNNEDVMFYPAGQDMWRNDSIGSIPDFLNGTTVGWENLANLTVPFGYEITALAISDINPQHNLYYGASSSIGAPLIFKLADSDTSDSSATDVSIPGSSAGAYVHNISVNPLDGDELIVTYSNYNIVGLYHSSDGGATYNAIEGNLTGTAEQPGPSLRAATIVPSVEMTHYFLGTSVGVYSTLSLDGASTLWELEGETTMGNVVVGNITSRESDGRVVIGTHGRGIFVGDMKVVSIASEPKISPERFVLNGNYPNPFNPSTTIEYTLSVKSNIEITIYNLRGQEITKLLNQEQEAGTHKVLWDASGIASGVYFYRLQAGDFVQTRKMLLLK